MLMLRLLKRRRMSSFNQLSPTISLSPVESKITTLLKDYTNHYNATQTPPEPLQLRITGGWVRDKLLGQQSNDLDIAVNILSGRIFAENLLEYLLANPQYEVNPSGFHTIEKNPEKSKHLETATTKLYGLFIDFVNLRNEEYTDDSRIPVVEFGTPAEDAMRRDATLNALFYNIQEDKVEDLTHRGLQDLKDGILRTPLEPRKTFLDDPLRVLRLIRFASRFGFSLDEATFNAMKDEDVKVALLYKISRERIGAEMAKTLESDPIKGLSLLCDAGLIGLVFNFGALQQDIYNFNDSQLLGECEQQITRETLARVEAIQQAQISEVLKPIVDDILHEPIKRLFWSSMVVKPWWSTKLVINKKGKQIFATDCCLMEGLKFNKADADIITKITSTTEQYQRIITELPTYKRSEVGLLLRKYGKQFELSLVVNLFDELITTQDPSTIQKYEQFYRIVKEQRLDEAYMLKSIIDGKTLSAKLSRKPGPWMSPVMDKILTWQLDNPEKTIDECLEYVHTLEF